MRLRISTRGPNQTGVSLVELLIVLATVGFLALLIANIPSVISTVNKSKNMSLAKDVAMRQVDNLRKTGYVNLTNGDNTFTDSDLSKLPEAQARYVVTDCGTDVCPNQEPAKVAAVTISWKEVSATKSVQLTTLISQGGVGQ